MSKRDRREKSKHSIFIPKKVSDKYIVDYERLVNEKQDIKDSIVQERLNNALLEREILLMILSAQQ